MELKTNKKRQNALASNPKLIFGASNRTSLGHSPIKLRMYTVFKPCLKKSSLSPPVSFACFSPLPPALPVMNLNYSKVTFHSLDLSVALLELAVLPHYYGALIDRPIPLQTRLTKNVQELLAPF